MNCLKAGIGLLGLVILTSSAFAQESPCMTAFRQTEMTYSETLAQLNANGGTTTFGAVVGGVAVGGCLIAAKNPACLALAVPIGVALVGYDAETSNSIQALEDSHRIYQTYLALSVGDLQAPEVQALHADSQLPIGFERRIDYSLMDMMEAGLLCKNGKPAVSWQSLTTLLKDSVLAR